MSQEIQTSSEQQATSLKSEIDQHVKELGALVFEYQTLTEEAILPGINVDLSNSVTHARLTQEKNTPN